MKGDGFRKIFSLKYMLVVPTIFILLLISIYPLVFQMWLSFTNARFSNIFSPDFIGVQNYIFALVNPGWIWESLLNTLQYVGLALTGEFILGFIMALLVYRLERGTRIVISLFLLPMCISQVFIGVFAKLAFHSIVGIIPFYMEALRISPLALNNPIHAKLIVAGLDIYQWTPFVFLILLAGLQSLPEEPIEAAKIDGASTVQIFRHVMLPMMRNVIMVALIIRFMDAFKTFDYMFILFGGQAGGGGGPGGPVGATTTISVIIYKVAYAFDEFGRAAAMTVILTLIVGFLVSRMIKYFTR
ncbi:carbohydrate ABC transporter permease [[Eubacterium] cellulosolvens]